MIVTNEITISFIKKKSIFFEIHYSFIKKELLITIYMIYISKIAIELYNYQKCWFTIKNLISSLKAKK